MCNLTHSYAQFMYACNKNNSCTSRISTFGELDLHTQGQAHRGNLLNKHLN